jgi:predicted nicotinamide N-methyase
MSTTRVNTVRLQTMVKGFWESAALMSGVELGLFTAISKGHNTVESAATALGIEVENAERLMTALTAMTLLERDGDSFTNAADVERFLVEGASSYAGPWMLFGKPAWNEWGNLTEHLRQPRSEQKVLGKYDDTFTVEHAREYHAATYSIGLGAARWFLKRVDLTGRKRIMDLGGGSGCYCIVAAQKLPDMTAVVLDLPSVAVVAREFIAENNVQDRVTAEPCDFTADALPTDADVAIMASNLPIYSREIIAGVVQRVHDALLPGGEFHLIGEILDDDRRGPIAPALWGLSEAVSGSTGLAHSESDVIGYFTKAGFNNVTATEFSPGTLTRITGYKS